MDPARHKFLTLIWTLVGCAMVAFLVYQFGFWVGRAQQVRRASEVEASAVYEVLASSGSEKSLTVFCNKRVLDTFAEFEDKYGKVESFSVLGSHSTPLGLPVLVNIAVKRRSVIKNEVLIFQSPNFFEQVTRGE